jgi:phage-related minor tail protein
MAFQSGTAFVPIMPSFRGFQARVAREAEAGGQRAGQEFGRSFEPAAERSTRGLGERLRGGLGKLSDAMGKIGLAGGAALGAGLLKAVDASAAQGKLQAQLGLTAKESQRFGKIAGSLYASAYGESIEDVNGAIAAVVSSIDGMRGASDAAVKDMTAKALTLAQVFDLDVSRAVQVVGQLVKSGLVKNATEGMDLLTATLQKVPAAVREDVLDALDEYGPFFTQIGIKGQQAFELLAQGAAKGMYGIDKTGDALKEFTIRATDMSASTQGAYKTLGLDTAKVTNDLLAGGQRGANAFNLIITKLRGIKDPAAQSQAALALFGTPLEDLSTSEIPKFLQSLDTTRNTLGNTQGAAQRMTDAMGNTAAAKIETFKRSIEQGLTQAAAGAIPTLEKLADKAGGLGVTPTGIGQAVLAVTGLGIAAKGASIAVNILTASVRGHSIASLTAAAATRTYAGAVNLLTGWRNVNAAMATNATLMTRLGAAMKAQVLLWRQQAAAQGVSTARVIAHAAVTKLAAAGTLLWAAATWVLNGAMAVLTSPITAVVVAIALLVGAVVLLYKKNETFRNFVNAAWASIKAAVMQAWAFIKPIFMQIAHVLVNVVGTALRWYWAYVKFVFTSVWTIISYAWAGIKLVFNAIVGFLQGPLRIAWVVLQNTIKVVWIAIQIYIKIAWTLIKGYFNLMKWYVTQVLAPVFKWLYNSVVKPVWSAISSSIRVQWAAIKAVWNAIKSFLGTVLGPAFRAFKAVAGAAWTGLKVVISNVVSGIKTVWGGLKSALNTVRSAFRSGVDYISSQWKKIEGASKKPVNFVIGIYNRGIVDMVNKLAGFAGVKTRLSKIPQLARGGTLDNPLPAQPMLTNGPMAIVGEGRQQYPEFVIPTDPRYRRRAQALWSMAGQKVMGEKPANKWLHGPNALNGEGIGFRRGGSLQTLAFGGIIGDFVKGVRNFTIGNVSKGAETLLSKVLGGAVPGSGQFRDVVAAVPGWIKKTVLEWVKKKVATFGGGPSMERALAWAKTQSGKPYQWGGNGNPSWDCSGFMSAIESVIRGQKPHRRWATSSFNGGTPPGWHRGAKSGFMIGVLDNGNAHASHTAGTLLGHNVESSGSGGVRVGGGARGFNNSMFPWQYGLKFDSGGELPQGATLALHNARRPDRVLTDSQWAAIYGAARGGDAPSTVNNIYARTADFTVRDLDVLERKQFARARAGRPR